MVDSALIAGYKKGERRKAKGKGQRAKGEGRRAKGKERRAVGEERRAQNKKKQPSFAKATEGKASNKYLVPGTRQH